MPNLHLITTLTRPPPTFLHSPLYSFKTYHNFFPQYLEHLPLLSTASETLPSFKIFAILKNVGFHTKAMAFLCMLITNDVEYPFFSLSGVLHKLHIMDPIPPILPSPYTTCHLHNLP